MTYSINVTAATKRNMAFDTRFSFIVPDELRKGQIKKAIKRHLDKLSCTMLKMEVIPR